MAGDIQLKKDIRNFDQNNIAKTKQLQAVNI